jgi:hypothetical protein
MQGRRNDAPDHAEELTTERGRILQPVQTCQGRTQQEVLCTELYHVSANPALGGDVNHIRRVTYSKWRHRRSTVSSSGQLCLRCSRRVKGQNHVCEACMKREPSSSALESTASAAAHLADSPVRKPDDEVETWPRVPVPGGRRYIGHCTAGLHRHRLTLGRSCQVPVAA